MSFGKILVVDDEKNITIVLEAILSKAGYEVFCATKCEDALKWIEKNEELAIVITDLQLPGRSGMEILDVCKKIRPELAVIIITAFGTIEAAVAALKQGAFDFITKPFDQDDLLMIVKKAMLTHERGKNEPALTFSSEMHSSRLLTGSAPPVLILPSPNSFNSMIIGKSESIQEMFKIIGKVSQSPSTVLLCGESGTGKELVALEIHRHSLRAQKPFIKINCAAIPATLIESELFGHEKGAFTGAISSKPGRFELAHDGTLFLDEVGEMPIEMQVKLLRVLQEQEFERVGGVNTIKVDVRIIAATNKNLVNEVKLGRFREDLYYRLNVVPIHLPNLRDRKEDLDLLVPYFLQQFNQKLKKNITTLTTSTLNALRNYHWPGNIRQLENVLERMVLMAEGTGLVVSDLPQEIAAGTTLGQNFTDSEVKLSFKEMVKRQTQSLEKELIEKALQETQGNVTRCAEKLGLSRKGLQLKLKDLGMRGSLN